MNKKTVILTIISAIISIAFVFVEQRKVYSPKELYRVYLKGETIGYIESKDKFDEYIDNRQTALKKKYKVDKVYTPNDIDIVKEVTYGKDASSIEEIYTMVEKLAPFTIDGYIVNIKGTKEISETEGEYTTEDKYVYMLDKQTFNDALKKTILIFVKEQDYNNFISHTQPEIGEQGSIIEDIYIKNNITIKEGRISTNEQIFTDADSMSKYLLFSTLDDQKEYVVRDGDSIADVANNNKLSVAEFLIANPEFTNENNLLYPGQVVNLGLINPLFKLVEEDHVVEIKTQKYETKIEYDSNMLAGYETVKQQGVNGTLRVTSKIQKENGEIVSQVSTNTEVLKPTVNKIIVRGNKIEPTIGNLSDWAWPTKGNYCITSPYGWRWGKFHAGIDISCTGYGSPIYAANNGVVTRAEYHPTSGNFIYINHNNGYYTVYAHLATMNVKPGQIVSMGQKIGTMGQTGFATGTHLHFSFYTGDPWKLSTQHINPLSFY